MLTYGKTILTSIPSPNELRAIPYVRNDADCSNLLT